MKIQREAYFGGELKKERSSFSNHGKSVYALILWKQG